MAKSKTKQIAAEQEDLQKWQRRYRMGILRSVIMLIAMVIVAVLIARRSNRPAVLSVTPTTGFDAQMQPVDTVEAYPADTAALYIAVELENYWSDTELYAFWYYEDSLIRETLLETEMRGSGYAGFELATADPPFPAGEYTVEIVFNEKVLNSVTFIVGE